MNTILQIVFNFLFNSILMFITACVLIEIFLFILRIKNYRFRYFARIVPFFKLLFDFYNYGFSNWAFKNEIDPQLFEKGKRMLVLLWGYANELFLPYMHFGFILKNKKTFSFADLISQSVNSKIIFIFCLSVFIILFYLIYQKILYVKNQKSNLVFEDYNYKIQNQILLNKIKKYKIKLKISDKFTSPCSYKKAVIFPKTVVNDLDELEIEAVISHEICHIIFKDGITFKIISILSMFFWFIPGKNLWIKKISNEREYACDFYSKKMNIDPVIFVNVLKKISILQTKNADFTFLMPFTLKNEQIVKRASALLNYEPPKYIWTKFIKMVLLSFVIISIIFGKLWIF
ncbi:MAG: M48 family metalloprotease [Parachlamydiales bacterium]|nr:M48 family metalloprotease [Parachlamydiales bacterium]